MIVKPYRVRATSMHIWLADDGRVIGADELTPANPHATSVRLDVTFNESRLEDDVLHVDAGGFLIILETVIANRSSPRAMMDRLDELFPGSCWLPEMRTAALRLARGQTAAPGESAYFLQRASEQLERGGYVIR